MSTAERLEPSDLNAALVRLLVDRGVEAHVAIDVVRQLRVLAESQPSAELLARSIDSMPPAARTPGGLARAESWIRSLADAIGQAATSALDALQPMPQVAGVRRALDADRFRIEGVSHGVQLGFECERLKGDAGWRLVGMLSTQGDVPPGVELSFVHRSGAEHLARVDDLGMFECMLPEGTYACSLRAGAVGTPSLVEFSVP